MTAELPLVLVVEDEPKMRRLLRVTLESNGMRYAEAVTAREAEVTAASTGGNHVALAAACQALEEAQSTVEKLYARWQELEAKVERGAG